MKTFNRFFHMGSNCPRRAAMMSSFIPMYHKVHRVSRIVYSETAKTIPKTNNMI